MALVRAYDKKPGPKSRKDKDLQFFCLRQWPETQAEFIFARSIIRGVVIFPAYDNEQEFLVFDILDPDMFLRVKEIQG